jgi:hypothetical protein
MGVFLRKKCGEIGIVKGISQYYLDLIEIAMGVWLNWSRYGFL